MRVTLFAPSPVLAVVLAMALSGCSDNAAEPAETEDPAKAPSATATSSQDAGIPRLRTADNGTTVSLALGATANISLGGQSIDWGPPRVDGTAVTISEDVSDAASGVRSWTVTARERGRGQIVLVGSPTCRSTTPPCAAPDQLWSVTFTVP